MSKIPIAPFKEPKESVKKELIGLIVVIIIGLWLGDYTANNCLININLILIITMPLALVGVIFLLLILRSLIMPSYFKFKNKIVLKKIFKKMG